MVSLLISSLVERPRCSAQVPGSVPFLSGIEGFPQYAGNVMVPFSNDFTLTSMA